MGKLVIRTRKQAEEQLESFRWYLDSGECPEDHKPEIRSAIGQIMDAIAKDDFQKWLNNKGFG